MISGVLAIDQTASRASYGLLTQMALMRDMSGRQKAAVMDNIAKIASDGDRMARIENKGNTVENMAADTNFSDPPEVALTYIERPEMRWQEGIGKIVNIFI